MGGIFSTLFSSRRPQGALLADVILMTALADGSLDQSERDGLAQALRNEELLEDLEWDEILDRAEEIEHDAPLFSDTRREVAKHLKDPAIRRRAITLAARVVGTNRQLEDEERAILSSIAEGFSIPEDEARSIIDEALAEQGSAYVRIKFNDPRTLDLVDLPDAIRRTPDDQALAALLFKPHAIRTAISARLEGAKVDAVGEKLQVGLHELRIDATVTSGSERWLIRCVAPGEALHEDEYAVLKMLLEQMEKDTYLMVVHTDELPPGDEAFLQGLDAPRLVLERIGGSSASLER